MQQCTSKTIEDNQLERNQIKDKINEAFKSYKSSKENYEKLIKQWNSQNKTSFDEQTNQKLMKSANDQLLNQFEQEAVNKYKEEQLANLLNEREELKSKLSNLEQTVEQYVQKEAAYKETLIKADKIVYDLECQYKQRIEQLESNEKNLKERIVDLEKQQLNTKLANSSLRSSLASTLTLNKENVFNLLQTTPTKTKSTAAVSGLSSPTTIRRNTELVAELLKCESRECQLREQIKKFEQNELNLKRRLEQSNEEKKTLEADLFEIEELNNRIHSLRHDLHQSLKQLDLEREKNSEFNNMIEQKELDFKKELNDLLEENKQLRLLIKQQQNTLISQEHNFVNATVNNSDTTNQTQINFRAGCDVNKNHVLQINVNETDTNRSLNSIRLHCN